MNNEDEPLGVAVVGVGGIATAHMAALRASSRADLVAVCDVDIQRAQAVAQQEGCRAVCSTDELLRDDQVDAVIVCTPNMTHRDIGVTVLMSGRHLLMEKPLALTVEDCHTLTAQARSRDLTLAVGHSHRFSDQGTAIRRTLDSGAIGTPRFVRIVMNGGWIWPGWQNWVLNPDLSGGHSLHNGVHLVDLAAWWLDEPATSVFAAGQHATSAALAIHDYLVIDLGFASGAAAICEVSRAERPRSAAFLELTIVGTDGVLTRSWDADGIRAWTDEGFATWTPDGSAARTFQRELDSFADAARGRSAVVQPVEDATAAVAVAIAAESSLASGHTVHLEQVS